MQEETTLFNPDHSGRKTSKGKKIATVVLILSVALLLALIIAIAVIASKKEAFHKKVQVDAIMGHLDKFNKIADRPENHNSRGVIEGYDDTADYVINILKEKANCDIEREYFQAPIFYEYEPSTLELTEPFNIKYQYEVDFRTLRYSGNNSEATGTPFFVPNGGCNREDFNTINEGDICLIEYDGKDCDLIVKGQNCEESGGSAMIIFNKNERQKTLSWGRVRKTGYWTGDPLVNIPCLSATYALGNTLQSLEGAVLQLKTNTSIIIANTSNIYCTTREGNPNNTIVAGAHLDSVPAGAGINDNGSGSASLLEIVIQWYKQKVKPNNRVKFAFWGAEELGLIGSRYYVNNTRNNNQEEFEKIAMALNFDMLGSPNYIAYINSIRNTVNLPDSILNGSDVITRSFESYFNESNVPYEYSPMNGGSDYYSFAEAGIPAGGLLTGAGGIKTATERTIHGGLANAAYDPCYHQSCDTLENINKKGLEIMSRGAAYTIHDFATMDDLRETLSRG